MNEITRTADEYCSHCGKVIGCVVIWINAEKHCPECAEKQIQKKYLN